MRKIIIKKYSDKKFDIVICLGPNDIDTVKKSIIFTKKYVKNYDKIYLISYDPNIVVEDCITIDENIFPFNLDTVSNYHGKNKRNGWYLQQLLKLYAGFIIENIKEDYLILDADVFFTKDVYFFDNKNNYLYNRSGEYHLPYLEHMKKLHPDFKKCSNFSGICHHMIVNKNIIKELILKVEKFHNKKFPELFLSLVDKKNRKGSGASEYEIYFNYMFKFRSNSIKLRLLKFGDSNEINFNLDYTVLHHYILSNKNLIL